ncbi:phosphatase [Pseudoroseomonas rhizosphaerae]|uniref:Phosphatase n=1 Tax=Teichococcus rhizosphaerae TaxID=1335062 RepID=A0A2C7AHS3_9PROT|nr:alkaline phosphatase PhoX [Pseudoroseomonas rhizosphaerae]PHK96694.1 phosphatase [Pseudoroseomonas rhizosphaerae]
MSRLSRRALLAAARPARAQVTTLDMPPGQLAVKLDDTVAPGYRRGVLARWGDRVTFDALPWNPAAPTPEAAATQFGWDGRICAIVPQPVAADGVPRAVLAVAHPTVDPAMAFPDGRDRPAVAAMMQGASLLNLERRGGRWIVADGGYQSRRLTADTLCRITGPAAGSVGEAIQGLLAVSGGCATPWGTLLLAEDDPAPWITRLGSLGPRFRDGLRFGWVAELDPLDPAAVPAKRTALARFPRGDAAAALGRDGRAVVYLTDRRAFGHLFRFVSDGPAAEPGALDQGTLSVARLAGQGLRWEALPRDAATRLNPIAAAASFGATAFDLPGGLAVDGPGGRLFLACKGNAARRPEQVDRLNPRAGSAAGHIVEIRPEGGDHAAAEAAASLLLTGGAPEPRHAGPGFAWPEAPATLALDGRGRLWIGTDHDGRVGATPDALYGCDTEGPGRGLALPVYGAPRGAALGGAAMSPDGTALFALARTPGAEPGASHARPGTRWPGFRPDEPPRSALLSITRLSGGMVGG